MVKKDDKSENDLSKFARIMRTSDDPEERRKAAAKMGERGGHFSHSGSQKKNQSNDNDNSED